MENKKNNTINSLDLVKLKKMLKNRQNMISSGATNELKKTYNTNHVADQLYPKFQLVKVKEIKEESKNIKSIVLVPVIKNSKLANFKAGQYIYVTCNFDNTSFTKPYFLSSSPKMAREGQYIITIKKTNEDNLTNYLFNEIKIGKTIQISKPCGDFTYNSIRDQKRIIGIASNVGIVPMYSLAQAILDGDEDVEMTLFYAANKEKDLIFKEELDDIVCKTNKLKVVYVLSEEDNEQYEHGLITIDLIKKEIFDAVSFFMAGKKEMIEYLNEEFKSLKLPRKYYRYVMISNNKKEKKYKLFNLTIIDNENTITIPCQSNETLLTAIEKAKLENFNNNFIFSRSKLVLGKAKIINDKRKKAEKKYNYINLNNTYPEDNCKIEIIA